MQLGGGAVGIAPGNVVLPSGTRALVVGLESAAAQQYNDKRGLVESFDAATERYLVKVLSTGGRSIEGSTSKSAGLSV